MRIRADNVTPLRFSIYFWAVATTAAAGLVNSIYLATSHYRVHTDILYTSFCATSDSLNCDAVSQSPYSIFLGIPVPIWGIFGYGFFLLLLVFARSEDANHRRMWPLLILVAAGFCIYSMILAYISRYYIHAYCIMCIAGYGINFLLLYLCWIVRRRFPEKGFIKGLKNDSRFLWQQKKQCVYAFAPLIAAIVLMFIFLPHYWVFDLPGMHSGVPTGVTAEGSPWIGANDPELVITEYTDYMCPYCKKAHAYMRKLVNQYPEKIRLVHKHFPLDAGFNPMVKVRFHEGAGKLAIAAAYALYEGKFWQMNDILYDVPTGVKTLDIKELAKKAGVNPKRLAVAPKIKKLRYMVKRDIVEGIKLGIKATPSYVINGKVYEGRIPVKVIEDAMK